jgi:hypothetical protein
MNGEEFHLFDPLFLRVMFGARAYVSRTLNEPDRIRADDVSLASPFPRERVG